MQTDAPVPKVGVVLVNWNGAEFTPSCLESLLAGTLKPARITVVDNASSDGSPALIRDRFPSVVILQNDSNLGFASATNQGVREVLAAGVELVWILNNDTVVDPQCLARLCDALYNHSGLGGVSARLLTVDTPARLWYAGAYWNRWTLTPRHRGAGEIDKGQYRDACEVLFLSGCCMLLRRTTVERVGFFDERYFAYWEDADWCLRALSQGIRLGYEPAAVLHHRVSASVRRNAPAHGAGRTSPLVVRLMTRNHLLLIRRHARRPWQYASAFAWRLGQSLTIAGILCALGRWEKLRQLAQGLREGLTNGD